MDIEKAYDSTPRKAVWKAMLKPCRNIPLWVAVAFLTDMVHTTYYYVLAGVGASTRISRERGLIQGCPLSATLWAWVVEDILRKLRTKWKKAGA